MRAVFMLIIMLFLHSIADYHLQGILASMKQKEWWKQHIPNNYDSDLYGRDYKMALATHAFEWTFVITLPILGGLFHACTDLSWPNIRLGTMYICILIINTYVHYFIDDLKCNDHKINLIADQTSHIVQVILLWIAWTVWVGW